MTDEDLIASIYSHHRAARGKTAAWREEAKQSYAFVAGSQWATEDLAALNDENRPAVTFNRIGPVIDIVAGSEVSNRQEVRYVPREVGDAAVNELLTNAAKWVRENCDAEDEESDAFVDCITAGMGWTETHIEYDEDPEGMVYIDRIDPLSMYWDPKATKRNIADTRWVQRVHPMTVAEFNDRYPGKDAALAEPSSRDLEVGDVEGGGASMPTDQRSTYVPVARGRDGSDGDDELRTVYVIEHQWFDLVTVYVVALPPKAPEMPPMQPMGGPPQFPAQTGMPPMGGPMPMEGMQPMGAPAPMEGMPQAMPGMNGGGAPMQGAEPPPTPVKETVEFNPEQFKVIEADIEVAGGSYFKRRKRVYRRALVCGRTMLEQSDLPAGGGFSFKCMTGKRDRNENTFYGLVRGMTDPQRWANKFFSQMLNIINANAKGGLLAETDAFSDVAQAEESWADPSRFTWLRPGGLAKVQQKQTPAYPASFDRLMQVAIEAIPDTSGINKEVMGLAGRDQPGVLEHQRKQAGFTILAPLFDALRRYRKEQGRLLLAFIREYLADGRLIRIDSALGPKYTPLALDRKAQTYDIIVDAASSAPNQKDQTFSILMQLLPNLVKMGFMPPPEMLDYLPLPQTLVAKWRQQIEQQKQAASQQPNPLEMEMQGKQAMLQLEMAGKQKAQELDGQGKVADLKFKQVEQQMDMAGQQAELKNKRDTLELKGIESRMKFADTLVQRAGGG